MKNIHVVIQKKHLTLQGFKFILLSIFFHSFKPFHAADRCLVAPYAPDTYLKLFCSKGTIISREAAVKTAFTGI